MYKLGATLIDQMDIILDIKELMEQLNTDYDPSVIFAFKAIAHCLRISVFSFIVFVPFIAISILNNNGFECRTPILCYGYLSFPKKPKQLIYYFIISFLAYLTVGIIYIMQIIVMYFLKKRTVVYLREKFPATSLVFCTPTFNIRSTLDKQNLQNFAITKIMGLNDKLIM